MSEQKLTKEDFLKNVTAEDLKKYLPPDELKKIAPQNEKLSEDEMRERIRKADIDRQMAEANRKPKTIIVKELGKVPKNDIFSEKTSFEILNKDNNTRTFVNGAQAAGLIGNNDNIKKNIEAKHVNDFNVSNYYGVFKSYKIVK